MRYFWPLVWATLLTGLFVMAVLWLTGCHYDHLVYVEKVEVRGSVFPAVSDDRRVPATQTSEDIWKELIDESDFQLPD